MRVRGGEGERGRERRGGRDRRRPEGERELAREIGRREKEGHAGLSN